MTLQGSGAMNTAQISAELKNSDYGIATVIPGTASVWLVGGGPPLTIPNNFWSRQAIKYTNTTAFAAYGTSHFFSAVGIGMDFPGRMVLVIVEAINKDSTVTTGFTITNFAVGSGNPNTATPGLIGWQGGNPSTLFCGNCTVRVANTVGTTLNVGISTAANMNIRLHIVVMSNVSAFNSQGNTAGATNVHTSGVIAAGNNAYCFTAFSYQRLAGAVGITLTFPAGLATLFAQNHNTYYGFAFGFLNRGAAGNYQSQVVYSAAVDGSAGGILTLW